MATNEVANAEQENFVLEEELQQEQALYSGTARANEEAEASMQRLT
jgi:hypothetical protein